MIESQRCWCYSRTQGAREELVFEKQSEVIRRSCYRKGSFLFITLNNCFNQKRDPGSPRSVLCFLALTPYHCAQLSLSCSPFSHTVTFAWPGPHSTQHLQGLTFPAPGLGEAPQWNFRLNQQQPATFKGTEMSQAAAAAAQGDPESFSGLLCFEGDGPAK